VVPAQAVPSAGPVAGFFPTQRRRIWQAASQL